MDHISEEIKKNKLVNNVINVNVNNSNNANNDSNGISSKKYAFNPDSFVPNTPETKLAEEVATWFNDLENYAFYLHVVKQLGSSEAYVLWKDLQEEIEEKRGSRFEIRSPKKYFAWKFARGLR